MKQRYLALLALSLGSFQLVRAQTTPWRPFRPGFTYTFAQAGSTAPALHTLRADSAYATAAGDSVFTFNRLLRPLDGTSSAYYVKSRNNLFGARLRWTPGSATYYLETNTEAALGATTMTLLLQPRAAVGSSWTASNQPLLTATLASRTVGPVAGGTSDSLATIVLSNGQQLVLSRLNGLLRGPQWLAPGSASWEQAVSPRSGLGASDPRALFDLSIGDELGYEQITYSFGIGLICSQGYELQRVVSRQLTTDSLVLIVHSQQRQVGSGAPGCAAAGSSTNPAGQRRWAFSLRTGQSRQFPFLALLTNEYRIQSNYGFMLYSLNKQSVGNGCLAGAPNYSFVPVYQNANNPQQYWRGLDSQAILFRMSGSLGVGLTLRGNSFNYTDELIYFRRSGVMCGNAAPFAGLLPTRAAQAASVATLSPNPTHGQTTLTLAAPAPVGTTLALFDALGRQFGQQTVAAGVTQLPVSLPNLPAGLYLVQFSLPGQPALPYRLVIE